jgi:hypothetical protein
MEYASLVVVCLILSIVAVLFYSIFRFFKNNNGNSYSYEEIIDENGNTITKVIDNNPESK